MIRADRLAPAADVLSEAMSLAEQFVKRRLSSGHETENVARPAGRPKVLHIRVRASCAVGNRLRSAALSGARGDTFQHVGEYGALGGFDQIDQQLPHVGRARTLR